MSLLLSRLKDFGERAPVAPALDADPFADSLADMADFSMPEPTVDLAAERAEAFAEGEAAATKAVSRKYEAEMAVLAQVHEREIAELTYRYREETAALLAARLQTAAAEIAGLVSDATARALVPVLGDLLAERAVADLAAQLREAIMEGNPAVITVKGPTVLYERLLAALPGSAGLFKHHDSDDIDLSVDIDGSVIVTRLSAWADSLRKVME